MAPRRHIIGGLTSVVLHGGLLAWVVTQGSRPEPPATTPVEVEWIELESLAEGPLALHAAAGSPGEGTASLEPARGGAVTTRPEPETIEPPPPAQPPPPEPKPKATREPQPKPTPAPASPSEPTPAPAPEPSPATPPDEPEPSPPSSSTSATTPSSPARTAGTRDGLGSGSGLGRMGSDESPDHSAYGAEIVRLVKAEIDVDPVPGLRPRDSIEVELEVLPNGRLARRGLGKYDYVRVIRSTLGPVRLRAILRRILRASYGFPPHPSSFPRQRYVVGFTVRFRDLHG